jgi:hypothetical protein
MVVLRTKKRFGKCFYSLSTAQQLRPVDLFLTSTSQLKTDCLRRSEFLNAKCSTAKISLTLFRLKLTTRRSGNELQI